MLKPSGGIFQDQIQTASDAMISSPETIRGIVQWTVAQDSLRPLGLQTLPWHGILTQKG